MALNDLIQTWFEYWENGKFEALPLAENFTHTSPYGTVEGKQTYLNLVEANREQFLGNRFEIHDILENNASACVRYTMSAPHFSMEVSEWFWEQDGLIDKIVSYYNIESEIGEDRQLADPQN